MCKIRGTNAFWGGWIFLRNQCSPRGLLRFRQGWGFKDQWCQGWALFLGTIEEQFPFTLPPLSPGRTPGRSAGRTPGRSAGRTPGRCPGRAPGRRTTDNGKQEAESGTQEAGFRCTSHAAHDQHSRGSQQHHRQQRLSPRHPARRKARHHCHRRRKREQAQDGRNRPVGGLREGTVAQ